MGFHKRYVSKKTLQVALTDLNRLLKADALIIEDEWSSKFIEEYQKLVKKLDKPKDNV